LHEIVRVDLFHALIVDLTQIKPLVHVKLENTDSLGLEL
jgi:hypothetical protein